MALILSGVRKRRHRMITSYGESIKQISVQAKKATAQSRQAVVTAKKKIESTKKISGQLTQAISKLRGLSLSGFRGYGATDIRSLKSQLEQKKKAIVEAKQIINVAKQTVKSVKSRR